MIRDGEFRAPAEIEGSCWKFNAGLHRPLHWINRAKSQLNPTKMFSIKVDKTAINHLNQ